MKTLPELAAEWGVTLDPFRKWVRRSPELRALGQRFGPAVLYPPEAAQTIKAAWDARVPNKPGRKPVQPAAA